MSTKTKTRAKGSSIRSNARERALQALCREYLYRLRHVATKHGLGDWLISTIRANKREECRGTEHECEMLSRMVNDERVFRVEVPALLGKTYSQCIEDEDFDNPKLKKLNRVGIYSKVQALLYAAESRIKNWKKYVGTK